ncbi:MAG: hypothetical protein CMH52_10665 [Myxococcales bacterium]|nr:hypothetical protein [Myxococcales bacterium]
MNQCISEAIRVIQGNDRGGYTVPTRRLYPYQWNWDSCFTALGLYHVDRDRAWLELTGLLDAQWDDGMVPHIVFRKNDPDYFPGPAMWQTGTKPPTSGHSQPPVLASVLRQLVEMGGADDLEKARSLFSKVLRYHRWFATARDPDAKGVIAIIHPWESGRDNCPDWDIGMNAISVPDNLERYARRDTAHVQSDQRPTHEQYDRYLTIVQFGREASWNHEMIYRNGPFLMADPGIQFIFLRANRDLLSLARQLDLEQHYSEIQDLIHRFSEGSAWLWNDAVGGYCARDIRTGEFSSAMTNASMLCFYGQVGTDEQNQSMTAHCRRILSLCKYGMPSWDPSHAAFESQRYWRGPVWVIMNHMIIKGLSDAGETDLAERLRADTKQLIEMHGMAEYFDPVDGTGLGGMDFSWTAAIYLHHLHAYELSVES